MHPVLMHIGPLPIYMYGLMIACGFLTIVFFMQRDAKKIGVDPNAISETGFWTLFAGILGARVAHIIMYPAGYSWSDPLGWVAVWHGGLVFQGAIPAALLYLVWALRRRGLHFWPIADLFIPYVPLAQAFGRVGCLCYGCCYGIRADHLPWAIRFPKGSPAFLEHMHRYPDFPANATQSFPVHPTQLYSVVLLLLIFTILLFARKKYAPFVGFTLPLYSILYGIKRFIVEMFRGDGNPTNLGFGILTNQQVFCVLMVAIGVVLWIYLRRRNFPPEPHLNPAPARPQAA